MDLCKIFVVLLFGFCRGEHRKERVINGELFDGRPTQYKSLRYYGAITYAFLSPAKKGFFAFFNSYGDIQCGGELISPKIVQTGCHCISDSVHRSSTPYMPARAYKHWENKFTLFFGVSHRYGSDSWMTTTGVPSMNLIVHEKCASMKSTTLKTYDYGIIRIPYDWWQTDDTVPYAWTEFESTPQYTVDQIGQFYEYAQAKQLVCLILGHGGIVEDSIETTNVILHGWSVLMTKSKCYGDIARIKYPRGHATKWACTSKFPKHNQHAGEGDSGGPVACDGVLFAINQGQGMGLYGPVDVVAPLIFNLFVNAIEFRQELMFDIDDLTTTYREEVYEVYKMHPTEWNPR